MHKLIYVDREEARKLERGLSGFRCSSRAAPTWRPKECCETLYRGRGVNMTWLCPCAQARQRRSERCKKAREKSIGLASDVRPWMLMLRYASRDALAPRGPARKPSREEFVQDCLIHASIDAKPYVVVLFGSTDANWCTPCLTMLIKRWAGTVSLPEAMA
ncbi:hypothetical protein BHE74_00053580 [Ensete ventricosum]|nr:hypothetical protein BHE74_00053580 [Ensete ventricosum]